MSQLPLPAVQSGPDWVIAEMPPGYQNRVAEIRRLSADLDAMGHFGRLLFETGSRLTEVILEMFTVLKFEATLAPSESTIAVKLDAKRRLLLHISETEGAVERKSPALTQVFQLLQEFGDDGDRVVLVTNCHPATRPADRPAPLTPDALTFLGKMGAGHIAAPTLFALWKLSLHELDRARTQVERLHGQDGGTFQLPSIAA